MLARTFSVREAAGGLEHDVDAEVFPRQLRRLLLGEDLDLVAVDGDAVRAGADVSGIGAVHRVVLEQVRERLGIRQVVDGDEVEIRHARELGGAQHLPSDSAEAVDANLNRHR